MSKRTMIAYCVVAIGAILGIIYGSVSTADFVAHLDRKLHPISCSLLPFGSEKSEVDPSVEGCKVALFSNYSSFWRKDYWGGVPWSVPSIGLFSFALLVSVFSLVTRRGHELGPNISLLVAALAATVASIIFLKISRGELHVTCATCVGTYISSFILLLGTIFVLVFSRHDRFVSQVKYTMAGAFVGWILIFLLELGISVSLPVLVYAKSLPDYTKVVTSCEQLNPTQDFDKYLISIGKAKDAKVQGILVADPLCPACKAFHDRFQRLEMAQGISTRLFLLPLDAECNWMLKDSMHPGACLLSRALLCSKDKAGEVLDWIFENQEELRMLGLGKAIEQIKEKVLKKFPNLADCIESRDTKIYLNKLLHEAADMALPLITPQFYVQGKRLCDEDTDLGLEYALVHLLGNKDGGQK